MKFCTKCGKELEDDAKFCPGCGTGVGGSSQNQSRGFNMNETIKNFNNTSDSTADYSAADIENGKGLSVVAYIGLLVLIPIFLANNNEFIRFHANQGLVLLIAGLIVNLLVQIPLVGWIVGLVGGIFCFVAMIIGIVNAVGGKAKELPLIGKLRILK